MRPPSHSLEQFTPSLNYYPNTPSFFNIERVDFLAAMEDS